MAIQFTFEDLKTILIEGLGLSEEEIPNDMNTRLDKLIDSLAFTQIQLIVQQTFGFTIPDEDAQTISTFQDAIDYTNRRLQEE